MRRPPLLPLDDADISSPLPKDVTQVTHFSDTGPHRGQTMVRSLLRRFRRQFVRLRDAELASRPYREPPALLVVPGLQTSGDEAAVDRSHHVGLGVPTGS